MEEHYVLVITHDRKTGKEIGRRIEKRPGQGPDPEMAFKALVRLIAEAYRAEMICRDLKEKEDL